MGQPPVACFACIRIRCFEEVKRWSPVGMGLPVLGREKSGGWANPSQPLDWRKLSFFIDISARVSFSFHFHSCPLFPPSSTVFCGSWATLACIRAAYKLIRGRHSDYSLYTLQIPGLSTKTKVFASCTFHHPDSSTRVITASVKWSLFYWMGKSLLSEQCTDILVKRRVEWVCFSLLSA